MQGREIAPRWNRRAGPVYLLARDEVATDRAITTTLRGARARTVSVAPELQLDPRGSTPGGVRRRNPVERAFIRAARPLARRPLGRLRSYLSEPMHVRSTMLESRLDRDFAVLVSERRQLDSALTNLNEQLHALREEVASLREELSQGHREPGSGRPNDQE